jgi:hypothetical protein
MTSALLILLSRDLLWATSNSCQRRSLTFLAGVLGYPGVQSEPLILMDYRNARGWPQALELFSWDAINQALLFKFWVCANKFNQMTQILLLYTFYRWVNPGGSLFQPIVSVAMSALNLPCLNWGLHVKHTQDVSLSTMKKNVHMNKNK